MIELIASDWYEVTGRGWSANISSGNQLPEDMLSPHYLLNTEVKIDGKIYTVKGVETFAIGGRETKYPRSYGFGLFVGEK